MPSPEILATQPDAGWTLGAGATRTIAVAKPDDEDTTFISGTGGVITICSVTDTGLTTETITSVTVRARLKTITTSDFVLIDMSDNAFANFVSQNANVTTAYQDFTGCTSATAPSGGAWSVAKLNALQVKLTAPDLTTARCTSLVVEVAYVTASGGTGKLLAILGAG